MGKFRFRTATLFQTSIIASIIFLSSCDYSSFCDNGQKLKDTKVIAEEKNELKFEIKKEENDAQFLVNAAEINLEGIKLAKLAQQNGSTPHVKELGGKLEYIHSESHKYLIVLAKSKKVSIPTSATENTLDAFKILNNKSGSKFDKAYADMMVSKHYDAIETFEKATIEIYDIDIRNWAITSLPKLRTHLYHSIECKKICDKS